MIDGRFLSYRARWMYERAVRMGILVEKPAAPAQQAAPAPQPAGKRSPKKDA